MFAIFGQRRRQASAERESPKVTRGFWRITRLLPTLVIACRSECPTQVVGRREGRGSTISTYLRAAPHGTARVL
jgi:hypothetical protein